MRTASEYLRDNPHARASTLASREKVAAKVDQLNREMEADRSVQPSRKSIIERFMPWFSGRRA